MILNSIVEECLLQHEGGEAFFDALDERIRNSDILIRAIMSKAIFNIEVPFDIIVVSGKFGHVFYSRCKEDYPEYQVVPVHGGLRKERNLYLTDLAKGDLEGKRVIFIDDSFYSGTTRNKIKNELERLSNTHLVATYVIYDGSKIKEDSVYSLYRYYET